MIKNATKIPKEIKKMTEEVETELLDLEKTVEEGKNNLQDDVDEIVKNVSLKTNEPKSRFCF